MNNNIFYKNRMAIKAICDERGVDAGVGTIMWAKENGVDTHGEAIEAWKALMVKYQRDKKLTLADLFK